MRTVVGLRFLGVLAREGEGMPAYMQERRDSTENACGGAEHGLADAPGPAAALYARATPR